MGNGATTRRNGAALTAHLKAEAAKGEATAQERATTPIATPQTSSAPAPYVRLTEHQRAILQALAQDPEMFIGHFTGGRRSVPHVTNGRGASPDVRVNETTLRALRSAGLVAARAGTASHRYYLTDTGRTALQARAAPWHERLAQLRQSHRGQLYLRFGRVVPEGRSRNYMTGEQERGISVFPVRYNARTDALEIDDRRSINTSAIDGRRAAYLVTGRAIRGAVGADGEPLLQGAQPVSRLEFRPEARGFVPIAE